MYLDLGKYVVSCKLTKLAAGCQEMSGLKYFVTVDKVPQ
jgi:hypothetical protein